MAMIDCRISRWNGQVLAATTDTPSQGAQLKVSGEPTPRDLGLLIFGSTPS